jgi:hypothetical protein
MTQPLYAMKERGQALLEATPPPSPSRLTTVEARVCSNCGWREAECVRALWREGLGYRCRTVGRCA